MELATGTAHSGVRKVGTRTGQTDNPGQNARGFAGRGTAIRDLVQCRALCRRSEMRRGEYQRACGLQRAASSDRVDIPGRIGLQSRRDALVH